MVTVDLNVEIGPEELHELEEAANRYLWQDRETVTLLPTHEELEKMTYRSKKELSGQVRIVTFPGADTCACCGTHVRSAGQVGLIRLLSVQKFREGVRIELVCGGRAMRYLTGVDGQNHAISGLLSAKPMETAAAVERLLEENGRLKTQLQAEQQVRIQSIAEKYQGSGDVLLFTDGFDSDGVRRLADAVLTQCGGRCACFSGSDAQGYLYAMGSRDGDLRALTKEMNVALQGRGGGKPGFVQGSVKADRAAVESFFRDR